MPKLAEMKYCTGCTACASACPRNCITMAEDKNGFLIPVIREDACIDCGMCARACPVLLPPQSADRPPKAYAAYSKDETLRLDSSSGGLFTELAKAVLEQGGAVFGAAYNDKFEVVHVCIEHTADLACLRGAKYVQSDLQGIFSQVKERLERGQQVLFSGTPCQVGGLKTFLPKTLKNLLTVDFVCLNVPSPTVWNAYLHYRVQKDFHGQPPVRINLRDKRTGWSRYGYSNLFAYSERDFHTVKNSESLYMKLFGGGYISRECCTNCRFKGYSRISDLTLGDFWGIWDIAPEMDDNKGTSVVLVHSSQGAELFDKIKDNLVIKQVTLEEASRENPAMLTSLVPNEKREEAFELIRNGEIEKCSKWFIPKKIPITRKLYSIIKRAFRKVFYVRHS